VSGTGGPVLWDVDTQVDFVLPHGRLAVPGAEEVVPQMARLVGWARDAGIVHVASADDHELTDPEISDEPDYVETYPAHCLRGTPGAARISETAQVDPLPLPSVALPPGHVARLIAGRRELLLLKKSFDVFTSPNADAVVAALAPSEVIVFGVATDVCDHAAVMGLRRRDVRVAFVEDAARGLDEERVLACLATWREAGVRLTTTDEVLSAR
jgi:nicotinamidase/pyrazinamidase